MPASLTLTAALENLVWACACTHHIASRLRRSSARPIDPLARACSVSGPSTCSSIIMYRRGATKVLIMSSHSRFSFTHHHAHSPYTGASFDCRICDDNTAIICRPVSKRRIAAEKAEYAETCTVLGTNTGSSFATCVDCSVAWSHRPLETWRMLFLRGLFMQLWTKRPITAQPCRLSTSALVRARTVHKCVCSAWPTARCTCTNSRFTQVALASMTHLIFGVGLMLVLALL